MSSGDNGVWDIPRHPEEKSNVSEVFFHFLTYFKNSYDVYLDVTSEVLLDNFLTLLCDDTGDT